MWCVMCAWVREELENKQNNFPARARVCALICIRNFVLFTLHRAHTTHTRTDFDANANNEIIIINHVDFDA